VTEPLPLPDSGQPTLGALFAGFFSIGISGFGGVLPWARRMLVEQRGWLTAPEFTDVLALCQFLPGPNVVNLSVAVGARFQGAAGALVSITGLLAAPVAIVIVLGVIYAHFGQLGFVQHGFAGLAAAASGLVLSMALRIAAPLRRVPVGVGIAAVTFAAVAVLRLPLLLTMLVLAPASILLSALMRS
jgi:chromate transporter